MAKAKQYSTSSAAIRSVSLPKNFDEKKNMVLLSQIIRIYEDRKHPGLSKTRRRGEVKASTRKIYRQKGTGLARHGALSAPIFVGGGKAHGPDGKKREKKLSKKMINKALNVAFSLKAKDEKVAIVNGIDKLKKTKEAQKLLDKLSKDFESAKKFTFAISKKNKTAKRALRNIRNVNIVDGQNLNAYTVFYGGVLVIDKDVFANKPFNKDSKGTSSKKKGKSK